MYVTYEFVYWQPSAADALLPKSSLSVTHSLTVTHRHSLSLPLTLDCQLINDDDERRRRRRRPTTDDDDDDDH